MKKTGLLSILFLFSIFGAAQKNDPAVQENVVANLIEAIAAANPDQQIDFTTLIEDLNYFYNHPINLNNTTEEELSRLFILDKFEILALFNYKDRYGDLLSIYEIQNIYSWSNQLVFQIRPFVKVAPKEEKEDKSTIKEVFKYGKHYIMMRYEQIIERQKGYTLNADNPQDGFLGDPYKLYFRYRFKYRDKVSFGIVADKDAGEQFFRGSNPYGFDFYTAHLFLKDIGPAKKIAIGDYRAQFGQGLVFWTGFGFGRSVYPLKTQKFAEGLSAYTSTNEYNFNRGAAAEFGIGPASITGFFSYKQLDASVTKIDTTTADEAFPTEFSSISEGGLHRTNSEIFQENTINEIIAGGNVNLDFKKWNIGATFVYLRYNAPLRRDEQPYNKFLFQGQETFRGGIDYNLLLGKFYLFGEFALANNLAHAITQGVLVQLSDNFGFTVLYRDFAKDYADMYTNAFADSRDVNNERGIYFGFTADLPKQFSLKGYFDIYKFPWLKFGVDAPSMGYTYFLQLNSYPTRNTEVYFRFKRSHEETNSQNEKFVYTTPLVTEIRTNYRLNFTYSVSRYLEFRTRGEVVTLERPDRDFRFGVMVYQDIIWHPRNFPLSFSGRIALFNTDDYDTRIYVYESDVLYAFSVPAYFYRGMRTYLNIKCDIFKGLDVWFRIAQTYYANRQTNGSGLNEIDGSTQTEFKIQFRLKLSRYTFMKKE